MKISGIYGIRNMVNGKWYVGQSVNVRKRKHHHFSALNRKDHHNEYLQYAFIKHGADNFEFRVLEETEEGLLDIQERLWIAHYKSNQPEFGYNSDTGGNANKHISEAHKLKISAYNTGRRHYENKSRKGRQYSEAWRINNSKAHIGKKRSLESRLKQSKSTKGRTWTEARRKHTCSIATRLKLSAAQSAYMKRKKEGGIK